MVVFYFARNLWSRVRDYTNILNFAIFGIETANFSIFVTFMDFLFLFFGIPVHTLFQIRGWCLLLSHRSVPGSARTNKFSAVVKERWWFCARLFPHWVRGWVGSRIQPRLSLNQLASATMGSRDGAPEDGEGEDKGEGESTYSCSSPNIGRMTMANNAYHRRLILRLLLCSFYEGRVPDLIIVGYGRAGWYEIVAEYSCK